MRLTVSRPYTSRDLNRYSRKVPTNNTNFVVKLTNFSSQHHASFLLFGGETKCTRIVGQNFNLMTNSCRVDVPLWWRNGYSRTLPHRGLNYGLNYNCNDNHIPVVWRPLAPVAATNWNILLFPNSIIVECFCSRLSARFMILWKMSQTCKQIIILNRPDREQIVLLYLWTILQHPVYTETV